MDSATFDEIKKMYEVLCTERDDILKKIEENDISIKEAENHKESILKTEAEDFKVFSPRTVERMHKDELEQLEISKSEYHEQNKSLYHDRNRLNSIIELLEKIIKEGKDNGSNLKILNIQEEERQRIARDLHDTSLQNLAHLIHKIELCAMFIDQDPVRAKLELAVVRKNLKDIINDVRSTVYNLRSMTFDDLGMKAAIERLLSQFNAEKKYELELDIDDVPCENNFIMLTIYRIVQEALNNINKHADADKVIFKFKKVNDNCVMEIADNGKGFIIGEVLQKQDKHFGFSLMKERVQLLDGKFEVVSEINNGTKIKIEIPLG